MKEKIEAMILRYPGVTGIDVSKKMNPATQTDEYLIRIFVRDDNISLDKLNLASELNEVPIEIVKREFHLH